MIALKGRLEREGDAWKWSGRWCFGTEFDEKPGARVVASMPFSYTWERPVTPAEVEIPPERGVDYEKDTLQQQKQRNSEVEMESQEDQEPVNNMSTDPQEDKTEKEKNPLDAVTENESQKDEGLQNSLEGSKNRDETVGEKMEVDECNTAQEDRQPELSSDSKEESKLSTFVSKTQETKSQSTVDDYKTAQDDPQLDSSGDNKETSTLRTPSCHTQEPKPELPVEEKTPTSGTRTFVDKANPDDPDFTDAWTKYADKCPPSGAWKGYFETTVGRKKPQAMPVSESFCLFLNATPASNARACFPEDMMIVAAKTTETPSTPGGLLPPGRVHVRGTGENQYGTFELIGSFDMETSILQCQRLYYPLPQKQIRSRSRKRSSTSGSIDTSRPARKRQLSWKKRAAHEEDDEPQQHRRRRSSVGNLSTTPSSKKAADGAPSAPSMPFSDTVSMVAIEDSVASAITPVALKMGGNNSSVTSSAKPSIVSPKRPQPNPPNRNRNGVQKISSGVGGAVLKLPALGDATRARWRAAHYLYYQKPQLPPDDGNAGNALANSNKSPTGQQAKFVIYEGDMLNSQRHGRGICLYTNGLLYEGEWYQDKEHGAGTIMSSDRKRIIYKGDFTFGKIHGAGIYYYYQTPYRRNTNKKPATMTPTERVSRYEGEFKETLRHGTGTYHLPDGSVYNGQFRDNQFFGRGTFTWPDGSVYDGEWKDGKRHGLGVLRSSDGFTYDGMWVNNAMDGRGSAVYPGGQEYNGLFSNGRREGRGTVKFTNGAVYEGRFRDDVIDGQGTMKMGRTMVVPDNVDIDNAESSVADEKEENDQQNEKDDKKKDFMIPLSFQSDMGHIHRKAGFTVMGE